MSDRKNWASTYHFRLCWSEKNITTEKQWDISDALEMGGRSYNPLFHLKPLLKGFRNCRFAHVYLTVGKQNPIVKMSFL